VVLDTAAHVASDGAGTWIAVWTQSPQSAIADIAFARSTDNGEHWTTQATISPQDTHVKSQPRVVSDGVDKWAVVWTAWEIVVGGDIYIARSADGGITWSAPGGVNSNAPVDALDDVAPQIATDGAGHWVAVWSSNNPPPDSTDPEIMVATSLFLPQLVILQDGRDFGPWDPVENPSFPRQVRIMNTGSSLLNFGTVGLSGAQAAAFPLFSDSGQTTLQPNEIRTLSFRFDPPDYGIYSVNLMIQSDDADQPLVAVTLTGRSVEAVWVDFNYVGFESGAQATPFNTLSEGIQAVATGALIILKNGTSSTETPMRITKALSLHPWNGPARVE
jgi:hypothetical protein